MNGYCNSLTANIVTIMQNKKHISYLMKDYTILKCIFFLLESCIIIVQEVYIVHTCSQWPDQDFKILPNINDAGLLCHKYTLWNKGSIDRSKGSVTNMS